MKVLLQISGLYKRYGHQVIFDNATASFLYGQKIGMIGRNGSGKTTLCKIITGHEHADDGTIVKNSELRLSYLEQQDPFHRDETVLDFLLRYKKREEWECARIAGRFGLKNDILYSPIGTLSGGYQTRVKLAAMLLDEPNLLLLDEPTNYLDLHTLILLENFLKDFPGTHLIISHDREFLKRTCKQTLEAENGNLTLFPGNVEDYLEYKDEQRLHIERYNKNIEAKQKQLISFIERNKVRKDRAKQAKSKLKQLNRLDTEKIEIEHPISNVKIRLPQVQTRKGISLECHDLTIGYPEKMVASQIDFDISRGARVAVLGDNGEGKTTFLRTLAGNLEPRNGIYQWGYNLSISYYAQHTYSLLNPELTIYNHLRATAPADVSRQQILDLAGSFLFQGDDVEKPINVLSGGERARVCLAGLLLSKQDVLLLDEPTNHLDFETVEALGNALTKYKGTLFFVSHDRTFVSLVATEVLEVKNGAITRYPGNYEEYVYHLEALAREEVESNGNGFRSAKQSSGRNISTPIQQEKHKNVYIARKEIRSEINKVKNRMKRVERLLSEYHEEQNSILNWLSKNPSSYSYDKGNRLEELMRLIPREEAVWLELTEQIESLNKQLDSSGQE